MAFVEYGMRLGRTTSFGSKRVALSNVRVDFDDDDDDDWIPAAPLKRQCSRNLSDLSALEDLPQEVLIKVLCGVEHDDLKALILTSKAMRDATLIVKQTHFAYSTPRKSRKRFNENDVETPEAPKQVRAPRLRRLSSKKLVGISVNLFDSVHDRDVRQLLREMETK